MQFKDIPKERMELLLSAIADLRPNMPVRIIAEDIVLYQLGLVQYVPCTIEICASDEDIEELVEEVQDMEIDALNFTDESLKKPEIAKLQKQLEDRYAKYAIIDAYLGV